MPPKNRKKVVVAKNQKQQQIQPKLSDFLFKDKQQIIAEKKETQAKEQKKQLQKPAKQKMDLEEENDSQDEEFEIIKKKAKTNNKKQKVKKQVQQNQIENEDEVQQEKDSKKMQEEQDLEMAIKLSLKINDQSDNQESNQQQEQQEQQENQNQPRRSARTRGQRKQLVEQNYEVEELVQPLYQEQEVQFEENENDGEEFELYQQQNRQNQQKKKKERKVAGAIFDKDELEIKNAENLSKNELKIKKHQREVYIEKQFLKIRQEKTLLVQQQQQKYQEDLLKYDKMHVIDKVLFDINQIRKNAVIKANQICKFGVLKEKPVSQRQRCTYWNTYEDLKVGCQVFTEPNNQKPYHNWLCFHCYKVYVEAEDDIKQLEVMFNKEKAKLMIGTLYLTNKNTSKSYQKFNGQKRYFRNEVLADMLKLFV